MADQRYIVTTVECQHCKAKQKVHVALRPCAGAIVKQTISCIEGEKNFAAMVLDGVDAGIAVSQCK